jgi:ketosteroid isomerase-like protein
MKNVFAPRQAWLLLLLLLVVRLDAVPGRIAAPDDELFRTISSLDAAVFDAFNRCDLETFGRFFIDDLEFYHDNDGLTRSRQSLIDAVKANICGKVRRELVPGTLEVHSLNRYGALEMGVHRFHHPGRDDTEPVGEGRFIHLWQNIDGAWKITRVISYDHHVVGH